MKKILVKGPALSQSGYGEQTRFALRSLRSYPQVFDVFLINIPWGKTGWIWEDDEERQWMDNILTKTIQYSQAGGSFDMSLQVTIPNEWENLAPINVGYTAGVESTKISPEWVKRSMQMNKIVLISEHAKYAFDNTVYEARDNQTGKEFLAKVETPIEVVHYPVKDVKPVDIELQLEHDFNFLVVAQWGPRKNMKDTIRHFVEEFVDQEVGLILKINHANNCIMDRVKTEERLKSLLKEYEERKCSVHLLHGDMTNEEMTALYRHPKIKALINLAHGEGFGLPMFEASYNELPVICPSWGGQCDFLYMPVKDKKGKEKKTPMFSAVSYDIRPIQEEAHWEGVLQKDSQWCYPKEWNYKLRLREMVKNYGSAKAKARKLKKHLEKNFTKEKMYEKFALSLMPEGKFEKSEYVFVSDNFVEQYAGGAELSMHSIMESCPTSFAKINSSRVDEELVDYFKDSKWVFGNIAQMNLELLPAIKEKKIDYSFIEFDYKFCKHRNPVLYEFVEGEICEYPKTDLGKSIEDFVFGAKSTFFMSENQKNIYMENFPKLKKSNTHVLSSVFDTLFFEKIEKLRKTSKKTDKWIILDSKSWVKGVKKSEEWCKKNNKEYELVGDISYGEFLEKLSSAKGICFHPDGLDTCPRFVIEAKLLGCELELNQNVQHTNEKWFEQDYEGMVKYLSNRKDYFWSKCFNS